MILQLLLDSEQCIYSLQKVRLYYGIQYVQKHRQKAKQQCTED